jgi:hypothetical protein
MLKPFATAKACDFVLHNVLPFRSPVFHAINQGKGHFGTKYRDTISS